MLCSITNALSANPITDMSVTVASNTIDLREASSRGADDKLIQPGYYWLAYEWSNLFASCQLCNEKFKKNWFPLSNPKARARSHRDNVRLERPLLLRPDEPDLDKHLGYRAEVPYAVNKSKRGKATIDVLGLRRPELMEHRTKRLRLVVAVAETIRVLEAEDHLTPSLQRRLMKLRHTLDEDRHDHAEYSMMVRAATAGLRL